MSRNIRLISVHNFLTDLKFHSAVLILYFTHVTGSYTLGMSLFSVMMVTSALFEIPTGVFSDRIGRRKTLILGSMTATVSAVLYALGTSYGMLLVGAVCEGLSRSFYSGNNDALLYDSLAADGKNAAYAAYAGKARSFFQIALAIGAFIGSLLASRSYGWVMWLSVLPQIGCIYVAFRIIEPKRIDNTSSNLFSYLNGAVSLFRKNKIIRLVAIQDIISTGLGESTFYFRSAFIATLWPIWAVGFSKMLSFAGATVSFLIAGKIIKKFGEPTSLLISRIYGRITNFISLLFPTVLSPVLIASTSLFYGIVQTSTSSLFQKEFSNRERATLSSVESLFGSLFFGICSLTIGYLGDKFGPTVALIMTEIAALSALPVIYKLKNTKS